MIDIHNIYFTSKHTTIYKAEERVWTKEQQEGQIKKDDMVIYLPKFRITNSMILMSLLRKLEFLTKSKSKYKSSVFQPLSSIH
jgi:type III secretory pathway component EscR